MRRQYASRAWPDDGRVMARAHVSELARRYLACRRRRATLLGEGLFADPAWDILLDLVAQRAGGCRVSVKSACIASGVAASTALGWIAKLEDRGLVRRIKDDTDARRCFVEVTERSIEAIELWLNASFVAR